MIADRAYPGRFFQAQITDRVDFSAERWAIRVDPGGAFTFTAGQYATLGVETPRGLIERPYSIVSSPYEHEVEFFLELLPRAASRLGFTGYRLATFSLSVRSQRGVSPSRRRATVQPPLALHGDWGRPVCRATRARCPSDGRTERSRANTSYFSSRVRVRAFEFGYRTEMQRMAEEVPWLMYVPTISRPWEHADWSGETGRVDDIIRKSVRSMVPGWRQLGRVSLRAPRNDRSWQSHPASPGMEDVSYEGRSLLHHRQRRCRPAGG